MKPKCEQCRHHTYDDENTITFDIPGRPICMHPEFEGSRPRSPETRRGWFRRCGPSGKLFEASLIDA